MNITSLGGRRFLLTLGCSVVCTMLVWTGKIDPTTFRDIILGTLAVYVAGNVTQKIKAPADAGG